MKWKPVLFSFLILTIALSSCQILPGSAPAWEDEKSEVWWHDAVFYQIFVRSFYDSNGDGIGDFNGITEKLDYLNDGNPETDTDLGVTGIWLMPIHPSPTYHGYDVMDYMAVNPQYGTMDDFKNMVAEAEKRGIHVIIDFVINHTSVQHPWFVASAKGEAPYADYYIWSDTHPGYKSPWGSDVWHSSGSRYYYGIFDKVMSDLNYGTPAVTEEIEKIANFWLNEVGIDGFRVDGAKHLVEEGQVQENTEATQQWFKDFSQFYDQAKPDAVIVGEIWSPSGEVVKYLDEGELDLAFNFDLANEILAGATFREARRINNSLTQQSRTFGEIRWATFLSNHDQTRVMTKVGGEWPRAKAAATLLFTVPGVPFIYYGEEIGMTGDKPDPLIRTPMQWSAGQNAGFSTGTPWQSINGDAAIKNVEVLNQDEESLLNHYRAMIGIRNNHYALREGQFVEVISNNRSLFAMLRVAEKETVLVIVNLGNEPVTDPRLRWSASPLSGAYQPTVLFGEGKVAPFTVADDGSLEEYQPLPEIPANGTVIVQFRK